MTVLIGTDEGLYRVDKLPFDRGDAERVLNCGMVTGVETYSHTDGAYVASTTGAYYSQDGKTWRDLDVPAGDRYWVDGQSQVWSVLAASDGILYAGTNDPFIYRSADDGETWTELKGFRDLPSRGHWESPESPNRARLRTLEHVPGRPEMLVAGIEAGGLHISTDGGRTWQDRRDTIIDDVHQVRPLTEEVWLAATGYLDHTLENLGFGHALGTGGIHRTTDAGNSWTRVDQGNSYSYIRSVFTHDGTLFFGGGEGAPPAWANDEHEAALFESTDFGRTLNRIEYPGEPHEVIETWTVYKGDVVCGSGLFDVPTPRDDIDGRIMRRTNSGSYETVGRLDANVSRLATL